MAASKRKIKTVVSRQDPIAFIAKVKSEVKRGKGCLYLNKLDDVDRGMRKLIERD